MARHAQAITLRRWMMVGTALVASSLFGVADAHAQDRGGVAVEIRGGGSVGYVDVSGASLSPAMSPAWGAGISYAVTQALSIHLGYDRAPFTCDPDRGFCVAYEPAFTSSGIGFEGRLRIPHRLVEPWIGGGVGYRTLSTRWTAGEETRTARSDGSMSLSAAAGADLRVYPRIFVGPAVRYVAHDRPREGAPAEEVRIVRTDLSIRVAF